MLDWNEVPDLSYTHLEANRSIPVSSNVTGIDEKYLQFMLKF